MTCLFKTGIDSFLFFFKKIDNFLQTQLYFVNNNVCSIISDYDRDSDLIKIYREIVNLNFKNNKLKCEGFYINNRRHREGDKPARIEYFDNDKIKYENIFSYNIRLVFSKYIIR